ncbi:hypothetical protein BD779DRAFT_1493331 [Infundibulicybe gibba]|nr:hypothetical protein BD779DRAFT_1493331 [Infundibulicybe gibba]
MLATFFLLGLATFCFELIGAGILGPGSPCSTADNHLDPLSHKFMSECAEQNFCSALNGTCVPRLCRRDEFPFGFGDDLPPLCSPGTFCPDDGSGCKPLVLLGEGCELNRDEQCAPPLDWDDLASAKNFNGSVCLHSTCMYANVTLGLPCVTDNTTYIDLGPAGGQQYTYTITRDNCHSPQLYCDPTSMTCARAKPLGAICASDNECETSTCASPGYCTDPPETPTRVAPWQYAITVSCILGAMMATCMMLILLHKRHRYSHYKDIQEYYYEQISLRRSIIALHAAAADRHLVEKADHNM